MSKLKRKIETYKMVEIVIAEDNINFDVIVGCREVALLVVVD